MYPRSAKFDTAYIESHIASSVLTATSASGVTTILPCYDGQISIDNQAVRRTATFDIPLKDKSYVPEDMSSLLSPFSGTVIRAYRGIEYPDATTELLPIGAFIINTCETWDTGESLHLQISCSDFAAEIAAAPFIDDFQIQTGTDIVSALKQIISKNKAVTFDVQTASTATINNQVYQIGDNPWEKANQLANGFGLEIYFDPEGSCVIRDAPDYNGQTPVWTFKDGTNSTLLFVDRRIVDEGGVNYVVVVGAHPDNAVPVRGVAYDNEPGSPTYINGPLGIRAEIIRNSGINDATTAFKAANARLNKILGATDLLQITAVPHPAFEVNDVVTVIRANSKVNSNYLISKIAMPFVSTRAMNISMGRRKVA